MAATTSVVLALNTLLVLLFCTMIVAFVYVIAIGGVTSCFIWTTRWDLAMLTNFFIYTIVLGAWYFYKESSWIRTAIFFVLLQTIGSIATIPYILFQFYKLSPEESEKDPLYFVLARHDQKREHTQGTSVVTTRIIFSALGCLMLGVLIYTLIMDIYAYHGEAFSSCFLTYIVDSYIHAVLLSVWIAYKESSWISASVWILSLVCLGRLAFIRFMSKKVHSNVITLCVYIVRQLFYLSREQHVSLIIFKSNHKYLQSNDPLLMSQANV